MGEARRKKLQAVAAAAGAERISDDERAYLLRVRQGLGLVPQVNQQIESLRTERDALVGANNSYLLFLAEKYGLDLDIDQIRDDGAIVRELPAVDVEAE